MKIADSYNDWSNIYDSNLNKTRDLDHMATKKILSDYHFGSVLELGCGTGKNTAWLIEKANEVVGMDFSRGMLDKARDKIKNKKITFVQADLNKTWPLGDQQFEMATINLVLEHIEDLDPLFNKAYLQLVPEGKFFVCELHPYKQYKGTKARFETTNGTHELEVFIHHISDYTSAAASAGFKLLKVDEWFDNESDQDVPRLISFVFEK